MPSFNRIAIVGYLGRDPELHYTPEGTPVCNFSVATTEKRKDKSGELQELTTWFQVALFGRKAENVEGYLAKGSQVWVEGSLTLNQWNRGDGGTRLNLEVRASDIKFLSCSAAVPATVTDDDLSFSCSGNGPAIGILVSPLARPCPGAHGPAGALEECARD